MAVGYKSGGNKLSRGLAILLSFAVAFILIYLLLAIVSIILVFFDIYFLGDFLNCITSFIALSIIRISSAVGPMLRQSGISEFLSSYFLPASTLFFILSFFWALIFRGYWKLILRPYMVIMTIIGFTIFCLVSSYFEAEHIYSIPILELGAVLTTLFPYSEETIHNALNFILVNRLTYVFAYYVLMYILCRIQVWLYFSSKLYYLLPSDAKDECISVLKEARKKAWGLPLRVKFYVANDDSFNAFAFAHKKVAINTGTLNNSDPELLRGVVAHELGHIAHLDVTANVIARTNFLMLFFAIFLPWILVSRFAPKEGERVNIFTYFIWLFFFLLMRAVQSVMNSINYISYLIGGKRSEYAADKFAVKIGEGAGLMRFMAAFIDAPSGGFSDPHPSIRNRLSHVLRWMEHTKHDNYEGIDIREIRANLL